MKDERGAVSTLVLFTVLFFVAILGGSYFTVASLESAQLKSELRIQQIYKEPVNEIENVYAAIVGVCKINDKSYLTLSDAIIDASSETQTTIQIIKDIEEDITIPMEKKIRLNLNNYKLTGKVINKGTLEINKGTVFCSTKNVILNTGNLTISETKITTDNTNIETISNLGTIKMTSGTVENLNGCAILNQGEFIKLGGTIKGTISGTNTEI